VFVLYSVERHCVCNIIYSLSMCVLYSTEFRSVYLKIYSEDRHYVCIVQFTAALFV